MKNIILIILLLFSTFAFSQNVGINSDGSLPNTYSTLDIKSTTAGMLIPRMTAAQRLLIGGGLISVTEDGMIVYQTDGYAGFYYYDGSTLTWKHLFSDRFGWELTGNSNTVPGVGVGQNYLGTSDVTDFIIASSGIERLRVLSTGEVGINTTPNVSSMLDISSTTKGLLIPRMTTIERNAIVTPANGLLVYDTDLITFYYYDLPALLWRAMYSSAAASSITAWSINGNAGIIEGTDYLGTNGAVDLTMRANSLERFRVNFDDGPEIAPLSFANSTGLLIGDMSGTTTNTGINIGNVTNTGTAIGITMGIMSNTGASSIGLRTPEITGVGAKGTGILVNPITSTGTTNQGILITGVSGGTENIGLKISQTASSVSNYSLYADASAQNYFAGNVGIGGVNAKIPASLLHVDGTAQLGTVSATTGILKLYNSGSALATSIQAGVATSAVTYTLPLADGTVGQSIITDGAGTLSWGTHGPSAIRFPNTGVFTVNAGVKAIIVKCVGGGGGGGGGLAGDNGGGKVNSCQGGGGGGGAYSEVLILNPTLTAGFYTVTLGAAGIAGTTLGVDGGNGGQSTFQITLGVNLCVANGGTGGQSCDNTERELREIWAGGAGGTITSAVGDITCKGQSGGYGYCLRDSDTSIGGAGGCSVLGGGADSNVLTSVNNISVAGTNGSNYGGGGSGMVGTGDAHPASKGGKGAVGVVIVYEYK